MALVDYFLKIDGVEGESQDLKHKGEIEIDSFSWGIRATGTHAATGGAGAGKVAMNDFHFTKAVDKTSPVLLKACATGEHIKNAILTCRKAGERQEEFLKVTFSDVLISSYSDGGAAQDDVRDDAAFHWSKAQPATGAAIVQVPPTADGTLVFDPTKKPPIQVMPGEQGVLIAGASGGLQARGVAEFDVRILIGLLTSPFGNTGLSLELSELRSVEQPPTDNPGLAITTSAGGTAQEGPQPHLAGRFDVLLYQPADLELNADDFARHGKKIGKISVDPAGPPAMLNADITDLITKHGDGTFGIRIQLHGRGLMEEEGLLDEGEVTGPSPHMIVMFTARLVVTSG